MVQVANPFSILVPLPAGLNAGPLHGNSLSLSAESTTIAASPPPTNVTCTPSVTSCTTLSWQAPNPNDNPPTLYRIYDSGQPVATVTGTSWTIPNPGSHQYWVSALQANDLESACREDTTQVVKILCQQ